MKTFLEFILYEDRDRAKRVYDQMAHVTTARGATPHEAKVAASKREELDKKHNFSSGGESKNSITFHKPSGVIPKGAGHNTIPHDFGWHVNRIHPVNKVIVGFTDWHHKDHPHHTITTYHGTNEFSHEHEETGQTHYAGDSYKQLKDYLHNPSWRKPKDDW